MSGSRKDKNETKVNKKDKKKRAPPVATPKAVPASNAGSSSRVQYQSSYTSSPGSAVSGGLRNMSKKPGDKKEGTDRAQPAQEVFRQKMLNPLNIRSNQENVYSAIAFFVHCREHQKVLLSKGAAKWFPFVQEVPDHCWVSAAKEALPIVLVSYGKLAQNVPLSKIQFLEILRFQPPERLAFFTRVTFYININSLIPTGSNQQCCRDTPACQWFSIDDILRFKVDMIWGPEVFDWCTNISQVCQESAQANVEPVFPHRVFEFTYDNVMKLFRPYKPQIGQISVVPPGSRCSSQDANRIYSDFLRHCYPAFGMTLDSFKEYFLRYRLVSSECRSRTNNRIHRYFNAFNYTRSNNLSFEELLLGLCEIDYDKKHNNTRIAFIFRFYDRENKGYLNAGNFEEILIDLNKFLARENKAIPPGEIGEAAQATLMKFNVTIFRSEVGVSQSAFVEGVGKHVFRGTSNLCRSYIDIFQAISQGITQKNWAQNSVRGHILKPIIKKTDRTRCITCRRKRYKLQSSLTLARLEPMSAQAISLITTAEAEHVTRWAKFEISNMQFTKESIEQNSIENIAFWVIKQMREFNRIKFEVRGFMTAETDSPQLVQILQCFLATLEPILKSEKRCKPCAAPAYIIGDIHGNIEDLMSLEQTIWPRFPTQLVNYVFLGDYVDRGKWGVEVALYLFAMKILSPYHVTLLRGNHEVRDIQTRYTYKTECVGKYDTYGNDVFELTNRLFDMLPLSAVIDDSMFCCHGGLPECIDTIEEINRESNDIQYPEMDSLVAWQIMWSDPLKDELFNEILANVTPAPGNCVKEGFMINRKRGAGHWFNEIAFRNFCMTNGLTHLSRAHEVPKFGFQLMFDDRLATIFSCSHYCKNDNDCAVLLVASEKIRVIRIDTSANAPAMDG